jgi:hypothetical protein
MRSATNWRAKYTGVSSVNTSVTMDNPAVFWERNSVMPGSPVMAISTGTVTMRSTSSGERPGTSVATCT